MSLAPLRTLTMLSVYLASPHIVRVIFKWVRSIATRCYLLLLLGRSDSLLLLLQRLLKILRTHDKCLNLSVLANISILSFYASVVVVLVVGSTTLNTGILVDLAPVLQVIT